MEPHVHRAVPDWGETQARGPSSSSPKLDDEAIARQLQQQYDREVNGTPGGVSSLEEDSVTVARRLQARTVLRFCIGVAACCIYRHSLLQWSCACQTFLEHACMSCKRAGRVLTLH